MFEISSYQVLDATLALDFNYEGAFGFEQLGFKVTGESKVDGDTWLMSLVKARGMNEGKLYCRIIANHFGYTLSDKISADKTAENLTCCRKFCPLKSRICQYNANLMLKHIFLVKNGEIRNR